MKFIVWLLLILPCYGAGGLTGIFNRLGSVSNVTKGQVFKDQSSSNWVGGRIFVRNKMENVQLVHLQPPSFSGGCGGIDLFGGAFSMISADQFVKIIEKIGAAAGSTLIMIALEEFSPALKGIMTTINDWVQKINQMQLNTCKTGEALANTMWSQLKSNNERFTATQGAKVGIFDDFLQGNSTNSSTAKTKQVLDSSEETKEQLGLEFNIAYKALSMGIANFDNGMKEYLMSITGTIISKETGDERFDIHNFPSLALDDEFLKVFLEGGTTSKYKCTDYDECLNMRLVRTLKIEEKDGLINQVKNHLDSILGKIERDEVLNDAEKGILMATTIPIIPILNIISAYGGKSPLEVSEVAELIAIDILFLYLGEIISLVQRSTANLKEVQVSDEHLTQFLSDLNRVRELLSVRRDTTYKNFQQLHVLYNKINILEQQLIPITANNYHYIFAHSLCVIDFTKSVFCANFFQA